MPKQYPKKLREHAVAERGDPLGRGEAGIAMAETLRQWVRRAEVDAGRRPSMTSEESAEIRRIERDNAELPPANEILRAASSFRRGRAGLATDPLVGFTGEHKDVFGAGPDLPRADPARRAAPSTYYAATSGPPSARAVRDERLRAEITRVWKKVYGADKLWLKLREHRRSPVHSRTAYV